MDVEIVKIKHPAKFHGNLLPVIYDLLMYGQDELEEPCKILDPFAGVGGIHALRDLDPAISTTGIEIEPEWAAASPYTFVGDALDHTYADGWFDAIVTSPVYGNRMSDNYESRDGSRRYGYRFALGREVSEGSSAKLQWGAAYGDFHRLAWAEAVRVLRPEGVFILNIKDHIRLGEIQPVSGFHINTLMELGLQLTHVVPVPTPSTRHGANGELRIDGEVLCRFVLI